MFYTQLLTACVCNVMFARDELNEITRDWDCINLGATSADTREWRVEARCVPSVETSKPPPSPHLHTRTTFRSGDGEQVGARQNCNEPTRGEKWSYQRSFTNFHIARWGLVHRDHKQFGYQRSLKSTIGYDSDLSNLPIACLLREGSWTALARRVRKLPQQVV